MGLDYYSCFWPISRSCRLLFLSNSSTWRKEGRVLESCNNKTFSYLLNVSMNLTKSFLTWNKLTFTLNLCKVFFSSAEARGKLKKLLVPILLALKFKSAVILPIVFAVLALVSLKALKVGLLALVISGKFDLIQRVRLRKIIVQLKFLSQVRRSSKISSQRNKRRSPPLTSPQILHKDPASTLKLSPIGIATDRLPVTWPTTLTTITKHPIIKRCLKMFKQMGH